MSCNPDICYVGGENGATMWEHRIFFKIKSCHDIGVLRPILWLLGHEQLFPVSPSLVVGVARFRELEET